jgi:hypothetical protein
MRTKKIFLLILLTFTLTDCAPPGPTATPDAPPPPSAITLPTDPAPSPAPIYEPTLTSPSGAFASAQIELVANIETAGIYVSGENLPETAELLYRSHADATGARAIR